MKQAIYKYLAVLVIMSFLPLFLGACARDDRDELDDISWQNEVLLASECGLEGLRCCLDKDPACDSGLDCCISPVNNKLTICAASCECGQKDNFCCGGTEKCAEGLACLSELCQECGDLGEACCDKGKDCLGDGAVCHRGECVECGLHGNPCCREGQACRNLEKRDTNRTECRNEMCLLCGFGGISSCLSEPPCNDMHLNNNGVCFQCGSINEPCCQVAAEAGDGCDRTKGLSCKLGFCE